MTTTKTTKSVKKPFKSHSTLKSPYMLHCHWPTNNNGQPEPSAQTTPVFISEIKRNQDGTVNAVKCFQTRAASMRQYDDPLMVRINDPHNRMGFEGDERVVRLREPLWLPFTKAFFGESPKSEGRMPAALWTRLQDIISAEKQEHAGSKVSRCPVYSWGA